MRLYSLAPILLLNQSPLHPSQTNNFTRFIYNILHFTNPSSYLNSSCHILKLTFSYPFGLIFVFGHWHHFYGRKYAHHAHHHCQCIIKLPMYFFLALLSFIDTCYSWSIPLSWLQIHSIKRKPVLPWIHDSNFWQTFLQRCRCHPTYCDGLWLLCGHLQALALCNLHELAAVWPASGSGVGGRLSSCNYTDPIHLWITLLWS